MLNIRELKDLRTREELINYFNAMGKNITDEEIAALKQSYELTQENNDALSLQQLDDVAGGLKACLLCCAPGTKGIDIVNFQKFLNTCDQFKNHVAVPTSFYYDGDRKISREFVLFVNDGEDYFSMKNRYAHLFYDEQDETYKLKPLDSSSLRTIDEYSYGWLDEPVRLKISSHNYLHEIDTFISSEYFHKAYNDYIVFLKTQTGKDLSTLKKEIPGLKELSKNVNRFGEHKSGKSYYCDYIDYYNERSGLPVTKAHIDTIIDKIISTEFSPLKSRQGAFARIDGLQELYDKATGLSKTQRNALAVAFGASFVALAGVAVGLAAYFGDKDKN